MHKQREARLTRLVGRLGLPDAESASLDTKKQFLKGCVDSSEGVIQKRNVFVLRSYYDLDEEGWRSFDQIGAQVGITRERASQLLGRTEKRLLPDKPYKNIRLLHKLAEMYEKGESCISDEGLELDGHDIGEAVASALEVLFGPRYLEGSKREFLKGFVKHL